MKLKKIASLMLASIMAVSMLAGCSDTPASSNGNQDGQNQVTPASVADYANSLLTDAQKNVFKFENSSDLTAALQKVAGNSKEFTSDEIKKYSDLFAYNSNIVVNLLAEDLADEMKLDYHNGSGSNQKGLASTTDKGTKSVGFVYALSGKMAQDSAVQLIIKYWASATMDNDDFFPATLSSHNLNCEYTADISAVKVTAPDDSNVSTWVVAIVVTQTATEAANV